MLCSSVIEAFFVPKRGTEIDRLVMSKYVKISISKNWSNVHILTSTTTYSVYNINLESSQSKKRTAAAI